MSDYAHTAVIDRLCLEFKDSLPRSVVTEVVCQCGEHLRGAPEPAMPELLERLARQRLAFLDTSPAWFD